MKEHKEQSICTTSGKPLDERTREINPATGMQRDYVVLCADERAKGFVRPVRHTYRHVGSRPTYEARDLTPEERERHAPYGYVMFEEYPESESPLTGRFWTQAELDARACNTTTTMNQALAETYARDPSFYSGTFCCQCRAHFPLREFVWEGTTETLGS
jgi:hypothetical protein